MSVRKVPDSEIIYKEYLKLSNELLKIGKTNGAVIALARKYGCSSDTIRYHILKFKENVYYKASDWADEWERARQRVLKPVKKVEEPHETVIIPAADIPRGFLY